MKNDIQEIPFSMKGSNHSDRCAIEEPHAPHVIGHYDTISYGALQQFCMGREGNGIHIHVDYYYGGSASMAGRVRGTWWQGEPEPNGDDAVYEFTGKIWPSQMSGARTLITEITGPDGRNRDHAFVMCPDRVRGHFLNIHGAVYRAEDAENLGAIPDGTEIRFRATWRMHKSPIDGWVYAPDSGLGGVEILRPWDEDRPERVRVRANQLLAEAGQRGDTSRFASEKEAVECVRYWRTKAGMETPDFVKEVA